MAVALVPVLGSRPTATFPSATSHLPSFSFSFPTSCTCCCCNSQWRGRQRLSAPTPSATSISIPAPFFLRPPPASSSHRSQREDTSTSAAIVLSSSGKNGQLSSHASMLASRQSKWQRSRCRQRALVHRRGECKRIEKKPTQALFGGEPEPFSEAERDSQLWKRADFMTRQLNVLVSEENYEGASKMKKEIALVQEQLSPSGKFMLTRVDQLCSGTTAEKAQACEELMRIGDDRIIPALMVILRGADSELNERTEALVWTIFGRSGRPEVDAKLAEGINAFATSGVGSPGGSNRSSNYTAAKKIFSDVIRMAPSFAEGYNKRATALYLMQDYRASIEDCERTLDLNPYHFGALSGMGICYLQLKEFDRAIDAFQRALDINPNMSQIRKYLKALQKMQKDRELQGDTDGPSTLF